MSCIIKSHPHTLHYIVAKYFELALDPFGVSICLSATRQKHVRDGLGEKPKREKISKKYV